MALTVHRPTTVDEFLGLAGDFLIAQEAEHNLLFGICTAIQTSPELFADEPPRFLVVTDADGRVVAASLRTPPNNQVLSQVDGFDAVDVVADALVGEALPGFLAPSGVATRFLERWLERTGQRAELAVAERIFRLERVIPPERPSAGRWRLAEPRDRELVADWLVAFVAEALPGESPPPAPLETADRWIAGIYRQLYLWVDGGRAVSAVGAGGATPNGVRIGPVYTLPEHRGRGYASALTAAASQDQLDRGRRFCFLFTDLANPTSNKIYQAIGFRPVCDMDQYRIDR
jgi:predicted GNAT family acetyltransferase